MEGRGGETEGGGGGPRVAETGSRRTTSARALPTARAACVS